MNDRIRREGTANLLAACEESGVSIVLQQSVAMLHCVADDRPQTETTPSKVTACSSRPPTWKRSSARRLSTAAWSEAASSTARAPTARNWLAEVRDPAFRIPGDGNAWLSPVHVEDYADALLAVLERRPPREAYIACDDAPLRLHELYARIAARAGLKPPAPGGPQGMRSFRTSNAKLRSAGAPRIRRSGSAPSGFGYPCPASRRACLHGVFGASTKPGARMTQSSILFEAQDGYAVVTLNRPDRLNSFNVEMHERLREASPRSKRRDDIRAVLLTGAGRGFCAGQDLSDRGGEGGRRTGRPRLHPGAPSTTRSSAPCASFPSR